MPACHMVGSTVDSRSRAYWEKNSSVTVGSPRSAAAVMAVRGVDLRMSVLNPRTARGFVFGPS